MELFGLSNRIFNVGNVEEEFFPFADLTYDATGVKEIMYAALDDDTDDFALTNEYGTYVLSTSLSDIAEKMVSYDISIYIEYTGVDGFTHNTLVHFTVYGFSSYSDMPYIKYIENLASRIDDSAEVILHCANIDDRLSVFLTSGTDCYCVPSNELVFDLDAQTISFVIVPGMLAQDDNHDACGVYGINLGYGDCDSNEMLPNSPDSNLAIIRYKYDSSNDVKTTTSTVGTEGHCWFASNLVLTGDNNDSGNPTETSSATDGYGKTMYVRPGANGCDCSDIKYYRVRLKYNTRLTHRRGELLLDGVQLKAGDIVWLAAQYDGTEGLWQVDAGDWYGLETLEQPVDVITDVDDDGEETTSFNPCTGVQVPKKVDCSVFVDLGATVDDKVDYTCDQDVPVKYGSQTVCKYTVHPGDIIALTNQHDRDGLWQVTCTDWVYLGAISGLNGTSIDVTDSIIYQNDIDFCKCGGIFHIDYYYLNTSCYLNHARRTVKILCNNASIAPNSERQFNLTDYRISTGEDESLVGNSGRFTVGDPVRETCEEETVNYDYQYGTETDEHTGECEGVYIKSPACGYICDCPKYYTVSPENFVSSNNLPGFTVLFWQYGTGGWHLFAYIGEGKLDTGMNYYVYHLHTIGTATVDKVDVNEETSYYDIVDGERVLVSTKDAWFVEHGGVLADGFGLVDDSWEFAEYDAEGERVPNSYTHILSENNLYQSWSVKCTTVFLAHRTYDPVDDPETPYSMRTTCADMLDLVKADTVASKLYGMEHVYGFRYYGTPMAKEDFVKIYNSYSPACVHTTEVIDVISTDDDVPIDDDMLRP